eukprot:g35062.t1
MLYFVNICIPLGRLRQTCFGGVVSTHLASIEGQCVALRSAGGGCLNCIKDRDHGGTCFGRGLTKRWKSRIEELEKEALNLEPRLGQPDADPALRGLYEKKAAFQDLQLIGSPGPDHEELTGVLTRLSRGKSSGVDGLTGLTKEFFRAFWDVLGGNYAEVASVLACMIHPNQSDAGWRIHDNVHLVQDLIHFCQRTGLPSTFLSVPGEGIQQGMGVVLLAYAGNVLLMFTDLGRMHKCQAAYLVVSSARITWAKCSRLLVGPWWVDSLPEELRGFSWSTTHLLYLEFYLSRAEESWPVNQQELKANVSAHLGHWTGPHRVLIINQLVASMLWYWLVPLVPPPGFVTDIQRTVEWAGRRITSWVCSWAWPSWPLTVQGVVITVDRLSLFHRDVRALVSLDREYAVSTNTLDAFSV